MSYESTIKYYDLLLQKYFDEYNDYNYPEILIYSLNFQKVIDYELGNDKPKYIEYLISGIDSLQKGGANFIVMAANSPHAVYNELTQKAKVPILSIVETTAKKALAMRLSKLLLIGIKFTMQSSFYQRIFESSNMEVITPVEIEQDLIDKIIFDELVIGKFKDENKQKLLNIIHNYKVDGVILGCTELPLILHKNDTSTPLLDTVEIHVEATLKYAIE